MLQLNSIQKRFGGVAALRNGTLSVAAGEIHLLLGENGAGKSTLMKIVAGMLERDGGDMLWQGRTVNFQTPAEASRFGVAMVHQESLLAPHLSVAENIFLGRVGAWVNPRRLEREAARLIEEHHFPLRAGQRVAGLSPAGKQLVEICRALQRGSSLLIFDEPTSSLSDAETQEVFRIVRRLRERNMGVIYITHRLEEVRSIGDRVTILRDGETVHSGAVAEISTDEIIRHMVGRAISVSQPRPAAAQAGPGQELLRVDGLTRGAAFRDVSFSLHAGEIVGMAGLVGAGRTEVCHAIFGVEPADSGEIRVAGQPIRIRSPREAVKAGIALVPDDRQKAGLALRLPLAYNITMASLDTVSRWGFLRRNVEKQLAAGYIQRLGIRADSAKQLAGRLSGGNQQKVVISKWLLRGARVFLFDEPTRGIDVGAKQEVFELMRGLARSGAAILMVSSELPELVQEADRILVMRQGRIAGELPRGATQEEIMRRATLQEQPS